MSLYNSTLWHSSILISFSLSLFFSFCFHFFRWLSLYYTCSSGRYDCEIKLKFSFRTYGYHNRESLNLKPCHITHTQTSAEDLSLSSAPGQSDKISLSFESETHKFFLMVGDSRKSNKCFSVCSDSSVNHRIIE